MKILFKTEGGFAYFPGLNKLLELDSDELPEEEASLLKQLISEADFFELPTQALESTRGADMKKYLIKVEEEDREHWVQVSDSNMEPRLQKLVSFLSEKRKEQKKGK